MRLAWEREFLYAREYPFVDYGIDLQEMAEQEEGVRVARLTVKPVDIRKGENENREIVDTLKNQKSRSYDKVPEKFVGKGPAGYLLYDII